LLNESSRFIKDYDFRFRIYCLLYADDVILLSNSQKGLQSKLDSLELFCKEWCMSVNISKAKVVIFNKSGRFIKQNLYNKIGLTVWSKICRLVLGIGYNDNTSAFSLKKALTAFLLKFSFGLCE
jgi:hypothetical protein